MSAQQPDLDPWANTNRPSWGNGNWLAVARVPADVLAHAALIIRARAKLEEAIAAPSTPVRPFLIVVARSRLADTMATTSTVTLTPPHSPLIIIILYYNIIDFVSCEKTQTVLLMATLLIQALFNCFTFVYFILRLICTK